MVGIKSRQLMRMAFGFATVGLLLATEGCGSSNPAGGTGGATVGTGGHGQGGSGIGGTTGTGGGVVDAGPPLCTGVAYPGAPVITDFSDLATPDGGTGLRIGDKGGVYFYGGAMATADNGALTVTGTVPAGTDFTGYAGVGLYFDNCIDATVYTGISFTVSGSLGNCEAFKAAALFPQIQPPLDVAGGSLHGVCTGTACYGPGSPFGTGTTMVSFAGMAGGGAVATIMSDDQSRITGVDFGFHGPAVGPDGSAGGCEVNFTIDNVSFY